MAVLYKNPIGRALGVVLKEERIKQNLTSSAVANDLGGIAESFYNLVENGTNYLHVNKSLSLANLFEGQFQLDGACKILMLISNMEATARELLGKNPSKDENSLEIYVDALMQSIKEFTSSDQKKLGKLLSVFNDAELLKSLASAPTKEAEKIIKERRLSTEVRDFLVDYENYKLQEVDINKNYLFTKINITPSIYSEFIYDFIERLVRLPVKLGSEEIWRWESENRHRFTEQVCITLDVKSVVSKENLNNYHYDILWEEGFRQSRIIFFSKKSAVELMRKFSILLRERLQESVERTCDEKYIINDAKCKLDNFDYALKKLKFKCANENTIDNSKLQNYMEKILDKSHRAINFLIFDKDNADGTAPVVGLLAKINTDNNNERNKLVEVDSLNIGEVEKRLKMAQQLWEEIANDQKGI